MNARTAQTALMLAATLTTGLMAGVFVLYAHTIMRGLGTTDDRTFVGAFQAIDRAIINPLFLLTFFGPLLCGGAAATLTFRSGHPGWPWVVTAAALYLATVAITFAVHLPLNDGIKASGRPEGPADLTRARARFQEERWVAWNLVRAVATTVAFACLAWALVLDGRAPIPPAPGTATVLPARATLAEAPVAPLGRPRRNARHDQVPRTAPKIRSVEGYSTPTVPAFRAARVVFKRRCQDGAVAFTARLLVEVSAGEGDPGCSLNSPTSVSTGSATAM